MEGLHLKVLCFFSSKCISGKQAFQWGFYVVFFSWFLFVTATNQAEINHLSVFLKSLASWVVWEREGSLLGDAQCGMRDILYTCEEPNKQLWCEKRHTTYTMSHKLMHLQYRLRNGKWCTNASSERAHHLVQTTLSSAKINWRMLAYMQSLWG